MEEKKELHESQIDDVSGGSAASIQTTAAECKFCGSGNIDFRRTKSLSDHSYFPYAAMTAARPGKYRSDNPLLMP